MIAEYASKLLAIMPLHQLSHEVDVTTGAERAPRAGDHNHANTAIASCRLERFSQVSTHMSDEGIQFVRTIKRNRQDAGFFFDQEVFVHGLELCALLFALCTWCFFHSCLYWSGSKITKYKVPSTKYKAQHIGHKLK